MRNWLSRCWGWLCQLCPLVTKREFLRRDKWWEDRLRQAKVECSEHLRSQRDRHEEELVRRTALVNQYVERLSLHEWSRDSHRPGVYGLRIEFDPRLFCYGDIRREDMEVIAGMFCNRIKEEIVTSKFVRDAAETERRRNGFGPRAFFKHDTT